MPIPKRGQKNIPLKDWRRFLRVADWFERTIEQGNGTRQPSYGQSLIVKTPVDGIAAAVRVDEDTTIFSATCIKCVAAETSTPGERTLHETDEELVVYNAEEQDVPGEIFVKTTLSPNGTRYVDTSPTASLVLRFELSEALTPGSQALAFFLDSSGEIDEGITFDVLDVLGTRRGRAYVPAVEEPATPAIRGSQGYAVFTEDGQRFEILDMQPHALRITGTADGTVTSTDDITLSSPVIMSPTGALAMEDLTTVDLVKNAAIFSFEVDNGGRVDAAWNEATTQWDAVQGKCPA